MSSMVEPEAGIMRLPTELRQMIYDYIVSDTPDRTIKVTLDQNDTLHLGNGKTINNLICTHNTFRQELPSYLFQCFTFVLTDSQRTCHPIVAAFFGALTPKNSVRVQKIAIPFFTIRGLFDPACPALDSDQIRNRTVPPGFQINPYVLEHLDSQDGPGLMSTQQDVLRQDLFSALSLLNQMPALKYLELGVDVIEFIFYGGNGFSLSGPSWQGNWFLKVLTIVRWSKRFAPTHPLLATLHAIRNMGKLRQVELKLKWSNFVFDSYTRADLAFPPAWTQNVKEEMEGLFKALLRRGSQAQVTNLGGDEKTVILI